MTSLIFIPQEEQRELLFPERRKKGKKKRKGFQIEKRVSSICTVLVLKIRLIDECALRSGLKHIEIEKGGLKF